MQMSERRFIFIELVKFVCGRSRRQSYVVLGRYLYCALAFDLELFHLPEDTNLHQFAGGFLSYLHQAAGADILPTAYPHVAAWIDQWMRSPLGGDIPDWRQCSR